MSRHCKACETFHKRELELRHQRVNLWRRGELSDALSDKLDAERQHLAEESSQHQAKAHAKARIRA